MVSQQRLDYIKNQIQRYRCCVSNIAYSLTRSEQYGKDDILCLNEQMNYLNMSISVLERYVSTQELINSYVSNTISDINSDSITYTPNISSFTYCDMSKIIVGGNVYDIADFIDINPGNSGNVTARLYLENNLGGVTECISVSTPDTYGDLSTLLVNKFNSLGGYSTSLSVNSIISEYITELDITHTFSDDAFLIKSRDLNNSLSPGINNNGKFREGRKAYVTIEKTFSDGEICSYSLNFASDASDGLIHCNEIPVPLLEVKNSLCSYDGIIDIVISNLVMGAGLNYVWEYSTDGITYFNIPLNDINAINPINESPVIPYNPEVNPVHIQLNNTYVYIRLSVFCEYSVSTVTSNVIQVSDSFLPIPILVVGSGGDVCSGNDIFLSADNVDPGQLTGNTYSWTSDNGFTSNDQYPSIFSGSPYFPSIGQTVTYTCTVTNIYGCSASGDTSLTVNSNPTIVVDTINTNDFTVHAVGGLAPYGYTIDFINFNSDGIFTGLTSGTTYTVYVSDGNGCQAQIDVTTL